MAATPERSLDRDLHGRAVQAADGRREADLVARALELAVATDAEDRAWALVRLAADLRALSRYDEALRVLDVASELPAGAGAELAVHTCAIAVHCDRGDHGVAVKLERQAATSIGLDLKLAHACVRLYAELYSETHEEEYRARRDSYAAVVESLRNRADGSLARSVRAVPASD